VIADMIASTIREYVFAMLCDSLGREVIQKGDEEALGRVESYV